MSLVQDTAMVQVRPDSDGPADPAGRLDEFGPRVVNASRVAPRAP
ncbi:hypothetical protein [Streptomyces sp. AS02]|nr:hypothetical protein [Streptomyces sp. AS02]